jgi:hypothetical protein
MYIYRFFLCGFGFLTALSAVCARALAGLGGRICAVSSVRFASAAIRPHRGTPRGGIWLTGAVRKPKPKKKMPYK